MIAFAYAHTGPKMTALYSSLVQGLIANIQEVMPDHSIMMVSDDRTPPFRGVTQLLRVPMAGGLMTWRLKCHQIAHEMADEIIFVEPDVRFREPVSIEGEFDIAVTNREAEVTLEDCRINTPFTLGMTVSRSGEFWRQAKLHCQTLDEKDRNWFGDMISVAHVIEHGGFGVKYLDGSIYNHVVNDPEAPTNAKVLHYKGKRKSWLFPLAVEA